MVGTYIGLWAKSRFVRVERPVGTPSLSDASQVSGGYDWPKAWSGPAMTAQSRLEADAGTRTPDPFITSEVLYQLSYVGGTIASYRPITMGPESG
jgi:hypothetical protein